MPTSKDLNYTRALFNLFRNVMNYHNLRKIVCTQFDWISENYLENSALTANKSPAVYILSPALDGLWRENRGSVNRLSWHGYDRLVYRLSKDELTMVRLLQLEVKAGFKPGCKQVSSWRHKRRSHEKGRRQNLDRRTGSDHSQRHYPLSFVIQ